MKRSFLVWMKFFLGEEFDWDQFSKPQDTNNEYDPVMSALQALEKDPRGREELISSKDKDHSDVLTQNRVLLMKKGIDVTKLQKLGQGAGGIAYDLQNGKVFKVTEDTAEAKVSTSLKGKSIPGVVMIYDTWKFPTSRLYGIILEKVLPFEKWPDDTLKSSIEEVVDTFNLKKLLQKHHGDWNGIWQEITSSPFADNNQQDLKNALDIFQRIVHSLDRAGINNFFDIHVGNIGKRSNGEVVVFDLGFAQGGQDPSTLNELLRWLKREKRS